MCLFVFAISVSTIALIGGGGRASSFPTAYGIWCVLYVFCIFSFSQLRALDFRLTIKTENTHTAHTLTSHTQTQTLPR